MKPKTRRNPNRHVFSRVHYFSTGAVRLLRFASIFVVLIGMVSLALGVLTVFSKTQSGSNFPLLLPVVFFLGGVASIWAHDFGQGTVIVTPSEIWTRNHVHRSVRKDDIDSLDIIHSDQLKSEATIPTLFLRNGNSIVLEPLMWNEQVGSEQPGWTYRQQLMVVSEIRQILRVGGQD
jgi:hypothetical protein